MVLPADKGLARALIDTYIQKYILYLFIRGKILSIYTMKKGYSSNTVLQDCRVGACITVVIMYINFPFKGFKVAQSSFLTFLILIL